MFETFQVLGGCTQFVQSAGPGQHCGLPGTVPTCHIQNLVDYLLQINSMLDVRPWPRICRVPFWRFELQSCIKPSQTVTHFCVKRKRTISVSSLNTNVAVIHVQHTFWTYPKPWCSYLQNYLIKIGKGLREKVKRKTNGREKGSQQVSYLKSILVLDGRECTRHCCNDHGMCRPPTL